MRPSHSRWSRLTLPTRLLWAGPFSLLGLLVALHGRDVYRSNRFERKAYAKGGPFSQ